MNFVQTDPQRMLFDIETEWNDSSRARYQTESERLFIFGMIRMADDIKEYENQIDSSWLQQCVMSAMIITFFQISAATCVSIVFLLISGILIRKLRASSTKRFLPLSLSHSIQFQCIKYQASLRKNVISHKFNHRFDACCEFS